MEITSVDWFTRRGNVRSPKMADRGEWVQSSGVCRGEMKPISDGNIRIVSPGTEDLDTNAHFLTDAALLLF